MQSLQDFLDAGITPIMALFEEAGIDPKYISLIPGEHRRPGVHFLPLRHAYGRRVNFLFSDARTLEFARQLVADQNKIIGYWIRLDCAFSGRTLQFPHNTSIEVTLNSIENELGWKIKEGEDGP